MALLLALWLFAPVMSRAVVVNGLLMLHGYYGCAEAANQRSAFFGNGGCHYAGDGVWVPELSVAFPVNAHVTRMTCTTSGAPTCITSFYLTREQGYTLTSCTDWTASACTAIPAASEPYAAGQQLEIYTSSFPLTDGTCPDDLEMSCALTYTMP